MTEHRTVAEFEYPIETLEVTLTSAELSGSGTYWDISGLVHGQPWFADFPREFMPTAPQSGPGYRFELTRQSAYGGELEIVGLTPPVGQRTGLTPEQIRERQLRAKIEHALSEMSTLGFGAGYLSEASRDAWHLVIGGPRRAGEAAQLSHGNPEQMKEALTTVLTVAARRGWWPKEIYGPEGYLLHGYTKVPLAQQHQQHPVPDLATATESPEVYQALARMWNLEIAQPTNTES